ncbi:hypothetical protein PAMA_018852 [Pampus argenteus]
MHVRASYALGIVTLFPYLQDPYSKHGYEHYYDPEANTGYLAWRLKTVQRNTHDGFRECSRPDCQDSPKTQRECLLTGDQLLGEECREALSIMRHSTDISVVGEKMRATFDYRQKLVHDQDATASVLDVFPRFLDIPGLIEQDFCMMFGDHVSGRFLTRWSSDFKHRVITECQSLPSSPYVDELLAASDLEVENNYGCTVKTLYLDEHFHAYCIEEQNEHSVIAIDQLTYFRPFDKQYSNDSQVEKNPPPLRES